MSSQNQFDRMFETVIKSITSTKNYHLALESEDCIQLLNFFSQHLLDVCNFRNLYKQSFIPAANKSVALTKKQYIESKYKKQINATALELKENLYETVRLCYVGLSHKVECFTKAVRNANSLIKSAYEIERDFEISKEIYSMGGIDFLNPVSIKSLNKIRIISNAVKHNAGYPQESTKSKDDIRIYFPNQVNDQKINIDPQELFVDMEAVVGYYETVNRIVNLISFLAVIDTLGIEESDEIKVRKLKLNEDIQNAITAYTY